MIEAAVAVVTGFKTNFQSFDRDNHQNQIGLRVIQTFNFQV